MGWKWGHGWKRTLDPSLSDNYFEAVLKSMAKKNIKGNHCICEYNEWQFGKKLDLVLEKKVFQKIKLSKNNFNQKCAN